MPQIAYLDDVNWAWISRRAQETGLSVDDYVNGLVRVARKAIPELTEIVKEVAETLREACHADH